MAHDYNSQREMSDSHRENSIEGFHSSNNRTMGVHSCHHRLRKHELWEKCI